MNRSRMAVNVCVSNQRKATGFRAARQFELRQGRLSNQLAARRRSTSLRIPRNSADSRNKSITG
jgi:hypothetical protein